MSHFSALNQEAQRSEASALWGTQPGRRSSPSSKQPRVCVEP